MKVTGAILREVGKPWQLGEFELGDPSRMRCRSSSSARACVLRPPSAHR